MLEPGVATAHLPHHATALIRPQNLEKGITDDLELILGGIACSGKQIEQNFVGMPDLRFRPSGTDSVLPKQNQSAATPNAIRDLRATSGGPPRLFTEKAA